jgi:hypothetical protein
MLFTSCPEVLTFSGERAMQPAGSGWQLVRAGRPESGLSVLVAGWTSPSR